jgi:hypothetical protein
MSDDVWLVAHRPRRGSATKELPLPEGFTLTEPTTRDEWVTAGIQASAGGDPSHSLSEWSGLTALIRVTGREVTIWRAGRLAKPLAPLSWGYQRTWVHPDRGPIATNPAATAAAFAASWRHAGGSVTEAALVELHGRRRLNPTVLRPALTALGLPAGSVSHLCARIPAPMPGVPGAISHWDGPALAS